MTATAGSAELTRLRECLANGARAQARFARDLTDLKVLAESSRPLAAAAASSRAAGEIAVRTRYIDGQNRCCGSCGGYVTDRLAAVVWQTNDDPIAGHTDGKINGVAFAASYRAGTGWAIELHAG